MNNIKLKKKSKLKELYLQEDKYVLRNLGICLGVA